jgi:hypothetical protein
METAPVEQLGLAKFSANEKVYVPHVDKHYEAKILKSEFRLECDAFAAGGLQLPAAA